jgi:CubicO group peptidase (beta-lactamase class C family)
MSALAERLRGWPARLAALARECRVPGASLAVIAGDEIFATACGVLNARTGVEATTDSVFQMGSITKVWTTTLVMQLVDEGKLDLDAPVREMLPEFGLADAAASRAITLRQLLTHTSGIDGDQFVETGRGDDAIERFVAHLHGVGCIHAPGARFSYCNAGFVVAGRLVEALRGAPYDTVLRERIGQPLGLRATGTLPEHAILHRAAAGHFVDASGSAQVVPVWSLQHSNAPAGATAFTTPGELLAFARLHLDDGIAPGGARLLSAASARAMRTRQIELNGSAGVMADAWGLGWELKDGIGGTLVGHSGVTIGQMAWLDLVPERRAGLALLTNGGDATTLARRVRDEVMSEVAGVGLPPLPAIDPSVRVDGARYLGVYQRAGARVEVVAIEEGLGVRIRAIWFSMAPDPPTFVLRPTGGDRFRVALPGAATDAIVGFAEASAPGGARFLEMQGRAHPRVV